MVRRPYNSRKQEDTLLCSYTGCNNVSSRLSLVEKALIAGLADLVQSYKINDSLNDTNGVDIIATKEKVLLDKRAELENLNTQKNRQYELLEQGIYLSLIHILQALITLYKYARILASLLKSSKRWLPEKDKNMSRHMTTLNFSLPEMERRCQKNKSFDLYSFCLK